MKSDTNTIDPEILKLFACPACDSRPPVAQEGDSLVCAECGRRYPVREGIPILLVEEATLPKASSKV